MLKEEELPTDNKIFDEIVLKYFDEHNDIHAFHLIKPEKIWEHGSLRQVKDWITLDQRIKASPK